MFFVMTFTTTISCGMFIYALPFVHTKPLYTLGPQKSLWFLYTKVIWVKSEWFINVDQTFEFFSFLLKLDFLYTNFITEHLSSKLNKCSGEWQISAKVNSPLTLAKWVLLSKSFLKMEYWDLTFAIWPPSEGFISQYTP